MLTAASRNLRHSALLLGFICLSFLHQVQVPGADEAVTITVQTGRVRQTFEGLGVGAIFYEGHITSLVARQKDDLQKQLYDDMFAKVPTDYLQLMIRETHEPTNDNDDPWTPALDKKNFAYCDHTLLIAKAALERRPKMQFVATLYTPPSWMKTNGDPSGGGEARATLKDGLQLELAEYLWSFVAYMQRNGVPIHYLCIANEPDWPHTQPGYCLTADKHAALLKSVGDYFEKMAVKYPNVPSPKFVAPNTLSAPGAAKEYVPQALRVAGKYVDVIASHDYDPRGDRWGALRKLGGKRPIWLTEWCPRDKDPSPGMIKSAVQYGVSMHDAFKGGVNVYMVYDWVYPPRDSGEALIHVNWGNDYLLTKPYYLFRQWAEPLTPGMKVVDVTTEARRGIDLTGVKPTAFIDESGDKVIVHVINAGDKPAPIILKVTGKLSAIKTVHRSLTSADQNAAAMPDLQTTAGSFADTLPAQSLMTYRITTAEAGK